MIPRIVHYAWFGGAPKPPLIQQCIDSWREKLPGWAIQEWNESNFDPTSHAYTRDAYTSRKWAFITDYVRLMALHTVGGVYMDADVEVVKPLDRFLEHRAFSGHETNELMITATMGAEPGHSWVRMLLDYYRAARFDGVTPNTQIITRLSRAWVERQQYGFRWLHDGVVIYPIDTFCPFDHVAMRANPTPNTHCIHHFAGSWTGRAPR